jgi:hypothetical protein
MFQSKVVANIAVATTALKMVGMKASDTSLQTLVINWRRAGVAEVGLVLGKVRQASRLIQRDTGIFQIL